MHLHRLMQSHIKHEKLCAPAFITWTVPLHQLTWNASCYWALYNYLSAALYRLTLHRITVETELQSLRWWNPYSHLCSTSSQNLAYIEAFMYFLSHKVWNSKNVKASPCIHWPHRQQSPVCQSSVAVISVSSSFSGSDDLSAKLWDVRTGQCIYGIQTHTCATVKFDEQKLVTGSFDNTIACWEWSTGAKIQQFRGHTGAGWQLFVLSHLKFHSVQYMT